MSFICGDPPGCNCTEDCPMPCWQRVGLTEEPCCSDCAPLPALEQEEAA